MFGRKFFRNCLLPVFTVFAILGRNGVLAVDTELPICNNVAGTKSPEAAVGSGMCKTGASPTDVGDGNYCITKDKNEIYKALAADSGSCTKVDTSNYSSNPYFVYSCNGSGACVELTSTVLTGITATAENILIYKYDGERFKQLKNNELYLKDSLLLYCPNDEGNTFSANGKCIFPKQTIFINPGTDSSKTSKLIKVKSTKGEAEPLTPNAGGYYLNGKYASTDNISTKLIYCESTTTCIEIDEPADGVYLDEATRTADNYGNVITCNGGSCTSAQSSTYKIFLNPAITTGITKALIKCPTTSGDCTAIDAVAGAYYINNAQDKDQYPLIKCGTKCEKVNTFNEGVYVDYGSTETTGSYSNWITCTFQNGCQSTEVADSKAGTYIDAAYTTKVITCTDDNSGKAPCKSEAHGGTNETPKYYIDASTPTNIITCNNSGCTSSPGTRLQGHAYISGANSKQAIVYDSSTSKLKLDTALAAENKYYINALNPTKLLKSGSGGTLSSVNPEIADGNVYAFYDDNSEAGFTITCSASGCISSKALRRCKSLSEGKCKDDTDGNLGDDTHCIHTDGKIYVGSNSDGTCNAIGTDILINSADENINKAATIGSGTSGYIYTCNSSSKVCTQIISSGYIDGTPTLLYTSLNGISTKVDVGSALSANSHYLVGTASISTTEPYITYSKLIKCPTANTIGSCVEVSTPTGIFKNYGSTDLVNALIICDSSNKCSLSDAVGDTTLKGYYLNSGIDKDTKPLIQCTDTSCITAIAIAEGSFVFDYSSKVSTAAGTTSTFTNLISCTSGVCSKLSTAVPDGYYIGIDIAANSIIHCENGVCFSVTHGGTNEAPTHYYDAINKKVITCNDSICEAEDASLKGYFLNSGNPDKPVIKCVGASTDNCSEVAAESTCSKVGGIKKDAEGHIFLCVSAVNTDPNHMEIVIDNTRVPGKIYRSVQGGTFPGSSGQSFTVRSDKDGKIILMEEGAGLPACVAGACESTKHCIDGNIIKTGNGACAAITGTGTDIKYFKEDTTAATAGSDDVNVAYKCTYDGTSGPATNCVLIKGYATITASSKTIYCSGWKNDPCTTVATSNELGGECENVKLINTGKICIKTDGETFANVVLNQSGKVIFYQSGVNKYYGISGTTPYFYALSVTADSALLTSESSVLNSNKVGYQINPAAFGSNKNALILCSAVNDISKCQPKDSNVGYYHAGNTSNTKVVGTNQLIKCDETTCNYANGVEGGYYIDALEKDKIIKCATDATAGGIICNSIDHKGTANAPTHFIDNTTDKKLLTCTNDGCTYEDVGIKGYFLNGAETEGKHLIKCDGTGTPCSEEADSSHSAFAGVGSIIVKSDEVYMCVAVGCSGPGVVKIESTSATNTATDIYKTIKISTASQFLDLAANAVKSFKFGNDGSVILLEPLELQSARSADTYNFNNYVIQKNNVDLITSESITEAGTYIFFFGTDNKMVEIPTEGTLPNVMAYQCTFIENENRYDSGAYQIKLDKCVQVKGYATTSDNKLIQCSGWKHEGCTVINNPKACDPEDEGRLGVGKKICLNGESISLPSTTATTPVYLAFKTHNTNPYYGLSAESIVYLQVTSNSVIVVDPVITENYTIENDVEFILKIDEEYKLYKYNSGTLEPVDDSNGVKSFEKISSDDTLFVAEAVLDKDTTILFYCYDGSCSKTEGYIVVGGTAYSNANNKWEAVTGAGAAACTTSATEVGNVKLVSNAFKLCVPNATTSKLVDIGSDEYFIIPGSSGTNLKMYVAGATNTIVAIPNPESGYYYIKDDKIYGTDGTGKLVKCGSRTCSIEESPSNGFYYNNRKISSNNKLIQVTAPTTHTITVVTSGYYLDASKNLIYCNGTKCSHSDAIGYFVNKGEENKYIKCRKDGCVDYSLVNGECSSEAQVGQLLNVSGVKTLCLKNGIGVTFSTAKKLVYQQSGSVFSDYVKKSTYFGLLDITESSMTLLFDNVNDNWCVTNDALTASVFSSSCATGSTLFNCNEDGVCIDTTADPLEELPASIRNVKEVKSEEEVENTSAADLKIECEVLNGNNCTPKTYYLADSSSYALVDDFGLLYYCESEGTPCLAIREVGHYIISETVGYSCKYQGDEVICEKTIIGSACASQQDIGKVFLANGKLSLCLNYDANETKEYSVELNTNNSGKYVIAKGSNDIFGLESNNYAIINITDKIITLNTKYENKLKYVYANIKDNYKILEKGDTCPKTTGATPTWDSSKIIEMKCTNGICCKCDIDGECPS